MVVSTGVANSFFDNPFVKDYLKNLNEKHRLKYRWTLIRLLRVYVAEQDKEVRDPKCCLHLLNQHNCESNAGGLCRFATMP